MNWVSEFEQDSPQQDLQAHLRRVVEEADSLSLDEVHYLLALMREQEGVGRDEVEQVVSILLRRLTDLGGQAEVNVFSFSGRSICPSVEEDRIIAFYDLYEAVESSFRNKLRESWMLVYLCAFGEGCSESAQEQAEEVEEQFEEPMDSGKQSEEQEQQAQYARIAIGGQLLKRCFLRWSFLSGRLRKIFRTVMLYSNINTENVLLRLRTLLESDSRASLFKSKEVTVSFGEDLYTRFQNLKQLALAVSSVTAKSVRVGFDAIAQKTIRFKMTARTESRRTSPFFGVEQARNTHRNFKDGRQGSRGGVLTNGSKNQGVQLTEGEIEIEDRQGVSHRRRVVIREGIEEKQGEQVFEAMERTGQTSFRFGGQDKVTQAVSSLEHRDKAVNLSAGKSRLTARGAESVHRADESEEREIELRRRLLIIRSGKAAHEQVQRKRSLSANRDKVNGMKSFSMMLDALFKRKKAAFRRTLFESVREMARRRVVVRREEPELSWSSIQAKQDSQQELPKGRFDFPVKVEAVNKQMGQTHEQRRGQTIIQTQVRYGSFQTSQFQKMKKNSTRHQHKEQLQSKYFTQLRTRVQYDRRAGGVLQETRAKDQQIGEEKSQKQVVRTKVIERVQEKTWGRLQGRKSKEEQSSAQECQETETDGQCLGKFVTIYKTLVRTRKRDGLAALQTWMQQTRQSKLAVVLGRAERNLRESAIGLLGLWKGTAWGCKQQGKILIVKEKVPVRNDFAVRWLARVVADKRKDKLRWAFARAREDGQQRRGELWKQRERADELSVRLASLRQSYQEQGQSYERQCSMLRRENEELFTKIQTKIVELEEQSLRVKQLEEGERDALRRLRQSQVRREEHRSPVEAKLREELETKGQRISSLSHELELLGRQLREKELQFLTLQGEYRRGRQRADERTLELESRLRQSQIGLGEAASKLSEEGRKLQQSESQLKVSQQTVSRLESSKFQLECELKVLRRKVELSIGSEGEYQMQIDRLKEAKSKKEAEYKNLLAVKDKQIKEVTARLHVLGGELTLKSKDNEGLAAQVMGLKKMVSELNASALQNKATEQLLRKRVEEAILRADQQANKVGPLVRERLVLAVAGRLAKTRKRDAFTRMQQSNNRLRVTKVSFKVFSQVAERCMTLLVQKAFCQLREVAEGRGKAAPPTKAEPKQYYGEQHRLKGESSVAKSALLYLTALAAQSHPSAPSRSEQSFNVDDYLQQHRLELENDRLLVRSHASSSVFEDLSRVRERIVQSRGMMRQSGCASQVYSTSQSQTTACTVRAKHIVKSRLTESQLQQVKEKYVDSRKLNQSLNYQLVESSSVVSQLPFCFSRLADLLPEHSIKTVARRFPVVFRMMTVEKQLLVVKLMWLLLALEPRVAVRRAQAFQRVREVGMPWALQEEQEGRDRWQLPRLIGRLAGRQVTKIKCDFFNRLTSR